MKKLVQKNSREFDAVVCNAPGNSEFFLSLPCVLHNMCVYYKKFVRGCAYTVCVCVCVCVCARARACVCVCVPLQVTVGSRSVTVQNVSLEI